MLAQQACGAELNNKKTASGVQHYDGGLVPDAISPDGCDADLAMFANEGQALHRISLALVMLLSVPLPRLEAMSLSHSFRTMRLTSTRRR